MAHLCLLRATLLVATAGAATVHKHVFQTDDAIVIEAAGPEETREKRQLDRDFNYAQTVIPPGWPGLPAGVTDDCSTPDGRSGLCVARTVCYWTRHLPPDDTSMELTLGRCQPAEGRAVGELTAPALRTVCCPGLFGGSTRPAVAATTQRPAPAVTNWWQTTAAASPGTTLRASTTPQKTTTTTIRSPPVAAVTQWWQTTEDPNRVTVTETTPRPSTSTTKKTTTKKPVTSSKKPTTTKRTTTTPKPSTTRQPTSTSRPLPSVPTIPPIITHPWQATSTAPPPQQTTGWWETTTNRASSSTTVAATTRPPTPSTTAWWETTRGPTTTQRPKPTATAWWQSTSGSTTAPTTTAPTTEVTVEGSASGNFSECGTRNLEADRIVGGEEAVQGEFPWMAGIFKGKRQFCGGSLIDRTHILTAAHCVAHMTPYDVRRLVVRLGDHDIRSSSEAQHEEFAVKRVVRHKGFSEQTLHTDIALLTLKKPVTYKDHIRPVCLAKGKQRYTNQSATVAGWGTLSEAGRQPSKLQKVSLLVWENKDCAKSYGRSAPGGIIKSMLCAGSPKKDSCSGDSGGPLMSVGSKVTQIGVVSWGIGCAKPKYPGVYTRVNDLLTWIEKNREAF